MSKKHEKDPTEREKDLTILLLQGIPLLGILIIVILGALNYEFNLGSNADHTKKNLKNIKMRIHQGRSLSQCGGSGVKIKVITSTEIYFKSLLMIE